jgi:hypothetical protein
MRLLANTFGQHLLSRARAAVFAQPSEITSEIPAATSRIPRASVLAATTICIGHRKG